MLEAIQRREHISSAVIRPAGLTARDLRSSLPSADLGIQQQVKVQQVQKSITPQRLESWEAPRCPNFERTVILTVTLFIFLFPLSPNMHKVPRSQTGTEKEIPKKVQYAQKGLQNRVGSVASLVQD
jgi:hypothetical protein